MSSETSVLETNSSIINRLKLHNDQLRINKKVILRIMSMNVPSFKLTRNLSFNGCQRLNSKKGEGSARILPDSRLLEAVVVLLVLGITNSMIHILGQTPLITVQDAPILERAMHARRA
jgi:hypothetical protein